MARWQALIATSVALATAAVVACSSFSAADPSRGGDDGGSPEVSTADAATDAPLESETGTAPIVELASGYTELVGIAATDATVYFIEQMKGSIHSVPIDGDGGVTDLVVSQGLPKGLAVSGESLFWVDARERTVNRKSLLNGTVSAALKPDMQPIVIAPTSTGVVVVARALTTSIGEVQQYTSDLVAGPVTANLQNPLDVAVVGSNYYWTESSAGRIGKGTLGGVSNVELATGENDCQSIAADATGVYWARPADGYVRASLTGTAGATTLVMGEQRPASLATDGNALYWLTTSGTIRKRPHGKSSVVETVARGAQLGFAGDYFQALTVTSQYVVWITTDGKVMRASK